MSGLFTRLAAQARGQRAVTLHSPASLPYRGAPEPSPAEYQPAPAMDHPIIPPEQNPAAFAPLHESSPDMSAASRQAPVANQMEPTAAAIRPPAATPLSPQVRREVDAPSSSFAPQPADTAALAALAMTPNLVLEPMATIDTGSPQKAADAFAHAISRAERHALAPMPHKTQSPQAHEVDINYVGGALSLPTALLSPTSVPGKQTASSTAQIATTVAPSQQADEVHIHIGRIEVTAIQESAPSKREARKGPSPLSLDDYLAKRKGDGR